MVISCCAYGCVNRQKTGSHISFHRFPRTILCDIWVKSIRRKNWYPNEHTYICSEHFTEDCFEKGLKRLRLKKCAVPTIFNFPPNVCIPETELKKFKEEARKLLYETSSSHARNLLHKSLKKEIHQLEQRIKRRNKQISNLSDTIRDLKSIVLNLNECRNGD